MIRAFFIIEHVFMLVLMKTLAVILLHVLGSMKMSH